MRGVERHCYKLRKFFTCICMNIERNFIYRVAANDDMDKIVALIKQILAEFDLVYDDSTSDKDLLNIEDAYNNNGGIFLIIENERNDLIGTVGLQKVTDKTGMIKKMYIEESHRGMGLGDKLLKRILTEAEKLNFEEVVLDTFHTMTGAIRLYEKYGFTRVDGFEPVSQRCDILMSKDLRR